MLRSLFHAVLSLAVAVLAFVVCLAFLAVCAMPAIGVPLSVFITSSVAFMTGGAIFARLSERP